MYISNLRCSMEISFLIIVLFFIFFSLIIQGIISVPDDEVWLIICLGNRPEKGVNPQNLWGSAFLKPGIHWFFLNGYIHKIVKTQHNIPFKVDLFSDEGNLSIIELQDTCITLGISAQLKISDNEYNLEDYWNAHYLSAGNNYELQAEFILNPYVKAIVQDKRYQRTPEEQAKFLRENPQYYPYDLEVLGVSNLSSSRLIHSLGLRRPDLGNQNYLIAVPDSAIGKEIISRLKESGLYLMDISITRLSLPQDVAKARFESSIMKIKESQNTVTKSNKFGFRLE